MANTYSTRLRLILQETGQNSGTWGTNLNDSMIQLSDDAIAGYTTVGMAAGTTTLSPQDGATDQARMAFIETNGTNTSVNHMVIPGVSKGYWIRQNATSAIIVRTAGGTGFTVSAGTTQFLICDSASVYCATSTQIPSGYAQGTFTPRFMGGTVSTNYNSQVGHYTRVGNLVHINANVQVSNFDQAAASGAQLFIDGLPFGVRAFTPAQGMLLVSHRGVSVDVSSDHSGHLASTDAATSGNIFIQELPFSGATTSILVIHSNVSQRFTLAFTGTYFCTVGV